MRSARIPSRDEVTDEIVMPPGGLLPKELRTTGSYPNMDPLGWRWPVPVPEARRCDDPAVTG